MAYIAPAGMAALTDRTAQDWISTHLQPNDAQMEYLFQHVYDDLDQVLTVCQLSNRQKYAVLRQGVTCEYLPRSRGVKAKGSWVTITIDV